MSRTTHFYGSNGIDPVLGVRVGVNAADIANREALAPRGRVIKLAVQLAHLQFAQAPRNTRPTLRVENIRTAQAAIAAGGVTAEMLREMLGVDPVLETERNAVARDRSAERKAARTLAAQRQHRRELRRARRERMLADKPGA